MQTSKDSDSIVAVPAAGIDTLLIRYRERRSMAQREATYLDSLCMHQIGFLTMKLNFYIICDIARCLKPQKRPMILQGGGDTLALDSVS